MKVFLPLLFTILSINTTAQWCYYEFTFEAGDTNVQNRFFIDTTNANNIWQVGQPDKVFFDTGYLSPNAIVTDTANPYPSNDTFSFTITVPRGLGLDQIGEGPFLYEMFFRYQLNVDSGDYGLIETSGDSGASWNGTLLMNQFDFATSTSTWQQAEIFGLSSLQDVGMQYIRFSFISDSIPSNKDGWIIDDICIQYWLADAVNQINPHDLISIHPNPSDGHIKLQPKTTTRNATIQAYNLSGQKVFETNTIPKDGNLYLSLPDGMYVLKYADEKDIAVKQLIIQH